MKVLIDGKEYNLSPDSSGLVKITFTKQTKDAIEIGELEDCQGTTLLDNIQLEQGNKATSYEEPNILIDGQPTGLIKDLRDLEYALHSPNGVKSSITQLKDSISLKVSNRDLLSQINVQANGILIQSGTNRLNITPDTTYIENGTIKSAMIKSLEVDKITGTNAQFTTLITRGLTADVITTDYIKAEIGLVDKIFSKDAYIEELTGKAFFAEKMKTFDLEAGQIKAGTIDSALIDAEYIVTNGLSTNVIKSEHINATVALINKLFSQEAYINALTSKSIFTEKIQAIDISADKITTGTLDASKVKVVNLDANNITANKTSFIQSNWNDIESSISINGNGLLSTASDSSQIYLQNGIVGTRNPQGATIGQIGYAYQTESPWYSMQISHGSHFQIRMNRAEGELNKQAFYIISGGTESYLNTDNIYLNPSATGRVRVQGAMTVDKDLRVDGTILVRSRLEYLNGGYIESQVANSNILINATNKLVIYTNGTSALEFDANNAVFKRKISDNSDIRLKTNIVDMPINSLEAIRNIEIKKFDYLDGRTNYYGIIAQQAQKYLPELINTDSNGYLMVDKSAMTYVNMHAIQQLNTKVDDEISKLKAQVASLQDELALLKGDRK